MDKYSKKTKALSVLVGGTTVALSGAALGAGPALADTPGETVTVDVEGQAVDVTVGAHDFGDQLDASTNGGDEPTHAKGHHHHNGGNHHHHHGGNNNQEHGGGNATATGKNDSHDNSAKDVGDSRGHSPAQTGQDPGDDGGDAQTGANDSHDNSAQDQGDSVGNSAPDTGKDTGQAGDQDSGGGGNSATDPGANSGGDDGGGTAIDSNSAGHH